MGQNYFNIIAHAAQAFGRPARKKEVFTIIERETRKNGIQLDQNALNRAWKEFKAVPVCRAVGF